MDSKVKTVLITTEYIELQQFLKLVDLISSGGEAKSFIFENTILYNGEDEKRRKKKLRDGDVIEVLGNKYKIKQKCI